MRFCEKCRRELPEAFSEPTSVSAERSRDALTGAVTAEVPTSTGSAAGSDDGGAAWSPIARLTNLAEVGFFADILEGAGFTTNVQHHNEFSAVDGFWQTLFILRVRPEDARAASERLRSEVVNHATGSDRLGDRAGQGAVAGEFDDELPVGAWNRGGAWKPILVVLIAGGLAYVAGRGGLGAPPVGAADDGLRQALSESTQPWTSHARPDGTGPRRRLQFDANSRVLLLEDDLDGDGQFDRQRRFRMPR
jgi:hypothetical protein